jgi:glycosyltransferase involved in cell wall biosynthesis
LQTLDSVNDNRQGHERNKASGMGYPWTARAQTMKACMVSYSFYEEDNRVRRYAEALVKRGDSVDVVALRKQGQPYEDNLNGVRIFRIQSRIKNEKSKFTYLGRLLLFFVRSLIFLTGWRFGDRYDLIHVHSVPDFEVFSALIPKLRGSKVILDIHDLLPEFYTSKFQSTKKSLVFSILVAMEGLSAAFSDHVIAANHIWEKRLGERSVRPEKCTTMLNFPDTNLFQRRGRSRNDGKFIILYPGTLNFHQGLDIAIRSFSLIEKQMPDAEFHIYGAGEQAEALRQLIGELGLKEKIFLSDRLPLDQIVTVMENADLGVVPKRSDGFGNEAFSTKILEFMSLGTPVIVPDTMVDKYYFSDSVAYFFNANDEKSLAEAMLNLYRNKELRQKLADKAGEFVKKYTWDSNCHKYFDLVDSLVHSPRSAGSNGIPGLTSDSEVSHERPVTKSASKS